MCLFGGKPSYIGQIRSLIQLHWMNGRKIPSPFDLEDLVIYFGWDMCDTALAHMFSPWALYDVAFVRVEIAVDRDMSHDTAFAEFIAAAKIGFKSCTSKYYVSYARKCSRQEHRRLRPIS